MDRRGIDQEGVSTNDNRDDQLALLSFPPLVQVWVSVLSTP